MLCLPCVLMGCKCATISGSTNQSALTLTIKIMCLPYCAVQTQIGNHPKHPKWNGLSLFLSINMSLSSIETANLLSFCAAVVLCRYLLWCYCCCIVLLKLLFILLLQRPSGCPSMCARSCCRLFGPAALAVIPLRCRAGARALRNFRGCLVTGMRDLSRECVTCLGNA